ncbi:hypothetical protein Peur_000366 [Populus x canadensis]
MKQINRYETKASPNYQMPAANHSCKCEAYLLNLILIPCLVAFEAGFHTELKAFSSSSSRYFIEHSVTVLFAHIFPN